MSSSIKLIVIDSFCGAEGVTEVFINDNDLDKCNLTHGQKVYWKDPDGDSSGIYYVLGDHRWCTSEWRNPSEAIDDRIIPIENEYSNADVYACELFDVIKSTM